MSSQYFYTDGNLDKVQGVKIKTKGNNSKTSQDQVTFFVH